jgi:hypothetical protein
VLFYIGIKFFNIAVVFLEEVENNKEINPEMDLGADHYG